MGLGKKAVGARALNILISIGIIALLFYGFYAYYGLRGKAVEKKITTTAAGLEESSDIVSLLRAPFSTGKNIADAIAEGLDVEAKVESALKLVYGENVRYRLLVDNKLLAKSEQSPSEPTIQQAALPTIDGSNIMTIKLEMQR